MDANTAKQLIELNRQFYQTFGDEFSATRQRIQPGVQRVVKTLIGDENILDLGCGNGELARALSANKHRGAYLGLDFSPPLLASAQTSPFTFPVKFLQADLTELDTTDIRFSSYDYVFCFAALHHIPGDALRNKIIHSAYSALKPKGKFVLSNWQFLNSPKLKARIQDWRKIHFSSSIVDENDYLLDWRSGGTGLRYVHHFTEQELNAYAAKAGFKVLETFYSDGTSENLSIYQVWGK